MGFPDPFFSIAGQLERFAAVGQSAIEVGKEFVPFGLAGKSTLGEAFTTSSIVPSQIKSVGSTILNNLPIVAGLGAAIANPAAVGSLISSAGNTAKAGIALGTGLASKVVSSGKNILGYAQKNPIGAVIVSSAVTPYIEGSGSTIKSFLENFSKGTPPVIPAGGIPQIPGGAGIIPGGNGIPQIPGGGGIPNIPGGGGIPSIPGGDDNSTPQGTPDVTPTTPTNPTPKKKRKKSKKKKAAKKKKKIKKSKKKRK